MKALSDEPRIPVRFSASDAGTEITLRDALFRSVASGVGALETAIPPGLYAVRYAAGNGLLEDLIEVPAELPAGQARLEFASAEPVSFTSAALASSPEEREQLEMAAEWSREPAEGSGRGASIFVFARDTSGGDHLPAAGFSLRRSNDANPLGKATPRAGCFGMNVAVAPGSYVLAAGDGAGSLEMPIVACAGWQTQVLLELRSTPGAAKGSADLENAAILMARPGQGFDPATEATRLSEIAFKGLGSGRPLARPGSAFKQELARMLEEKFVNPLLGIYGLHLLLAEKERDSGLIEVVCRNLANLGLEDHPDLRAIRLEAGVDTAGLNDEFPEPPMLLASWRLVLEQSARNPGSMRRKSLSARIASRIVGAGPWLIWRSPEVAEKAPLRPRTDLRDTSRSSWRSYSLDELEGLRGNTATRSPAKGKGLRGRRDDDVFRDDDGLEGIKGLDARGYEDADQDRHFDDDFLGAPLSSYRTFPLEDSEDSRDTVEAAEWTPAKLTYLEKTVEQALLAQERSSAPDIPSLVRSLGLPAATIEDTIESLHKKSR